MDNRYTTPFTRSLFGEEEKRRRWLDVEIAYIGILGIQGLIPKDEADEVTLRTNYRHAIYSGAIRREENRTRHDVAAFVNVAASAVAKPARRWFHYGLTSSDLVDTGEGLAYRAYHGELQEQAHQLMSALETRRDQVGQAVRMGRTHGQHAEPILVQRDFDRWADLVARVAQHRPVFYGKLSGATGSNYVVSRETEGATLTSLGLATDWRATQVVSRDLYMPWFFQMTQLVSVIEQIATWVRLSSITEVQEVSEPFGTKQVGSSAMPHKRNPVRSERLVGLAKVARGYFATLQSEAPALWWERDISNSSVERVVARDLLHLVMWMTMEATDLVEHLVINVEAMERRVADVLTEGGPSSLRLAALIRGGMSRKKAYKLVRDNGDFELTPIELCTLDYYRNER